jgi:hypothetical protein
MSSSKVAIFGGSTGPVAALGNMDISGPLGPNAPVGPVASIGSIGSDVPVGPVSLIAYLMLNQFHFFSCKNTRCRQVHKVFKEFR